MKNFNLFVFAMVAFGMIAGAWIFLFVAPAKPSVSPPAVIACSCGDACDCDDCKCEAADCLAPPVVALPDPSARPEPPPVVVEPAAESAADACEDGYCPTSYSPRRQFRPFGGFFRRR